MKKGIGENWERVKSRNVLFEVEGRNVKKITMELSEEEMEKRKYAIEGEEIGLGHEIYVDIGEFDSKVKHKKFEYGKLPIVFYL